MRNDIAKIYLKARNDFGTRYNDEYCTMIRNLFIKNLYFITIPWIAKLHEYPKCFKIAWISLMFQEYVVRHVNWQERWVISIRREY